MAKRSEVRSKIRAAEKILEEARRMMVDTDTDFNSEEVHLVAMAQYTIGKARERLEPSK